jgi:hypothetical protein
MNNKTISEATNLSNQDSFPQSNAVPPQSNPFTGELKGEFTSDFGTNTNAVSQIFKGGGFGSPDRNKYIIIGVIVVIVLGLAGYFLFSGDSEEEATDETATEEQVAQGEEGEAAAEGETAEGQAGQQQAAEGETAEGQAGQQQAAEGEQAQASAEQATGQQAAAPAQEAAPAAAGSGGAISIVQPNNGAGHDYDETQGPAMFEWSGAADRIVFSRNPNMTPIERSVALGGKSSYQFDHPYPGTWYWRVENASGASEVRSFTVNPPVRRNFPISQPAAGTPISGNGGVVAWQADSKVAWYSVQLTAPGSGWANPQYRFGTSGTSVALQGVPAGSYDMRVGAFSEVSGRWEWQEIKGVTVQ